MTVYFTNNILKLFIIFYKVQIINILYLFIYLLYLRYLRRQLWCAIDWTLTQFDLWFTIFHSERWLECKKWLECTRNLFLCKLLLLYLVDIKVFELRLSLFNILSESFRSLGFAFLHLYRSCCTKIFDFIYTIIYVLESSCYRGLWRFINISYSLEFHTFFKSLI